MKRIVLLGVDGDTSIDVTCAQVQQVLDVERDVGIIGVGYIAFETQCGLPVPEDVHPIQLDPNDVSGSVHREIETTRKKGAVIHVCPREQLPQREQQFSRLGYCAEPIDLRYL